MISDPIVPGEGRAGDDLDPSEGEHRADGQEHQQD